MDTVLYFGNVVVERRARRGGVAYLSPPLSIIYFDLLPNLYILEIHLWIDTIVPDFVPQSPVMTSQDYETYTLGDFALKDGGSIPNAYIAYKTFGDSKNPAILYPSWYSGGEQTFPFSILRVFNFNSLSQPSPITNG